MVTRTDGGSDEYHLIWDVAAPTPKLLSVEVNGVRSDLVHGAREALLVTGSHADPIEFNALGDVTSAGALTVATAYDPYGVPSTDHGGLGLGYRGELHVGPLVHLRTRELDPQLGRFTTTDPLLGVAGTTTVANGYHYADNDPVNRSDPSGLRATDGYLDRLLAQPDVERLAEFGLIQGAGFPFWLFNPWHRAVQLDLAARVGGRIECPIPGAGPHGGVGRADVCTATRLWEVKYFGPNALDTAREQLARYERFSNLTRGRIVASSTVAAAGVQLFAFSPEPGIRLYFPKTWTPAIQRDPVRLRELERAVDVRTLQELGIRSVTTPAPSSPGIGLPDVRLPEIPAPDPETAAGVGGALVTIGIVACLLILCGIPVVPGPI